MSEFVSRVFLFGVLLFYAGLVMAFLLWNLRQWLRGTGNKRAWFAILARFGAWRFLNRPSDAR